MSFFECRVNIRGALRCDEYAVSGFVPGGVVHLIYFVTELTKFRNIFS